MLSDYLGIFSLNYFIVFTSNIINHVNVFWLDGYYFITINQLKDDFLSSKFIVSYNVKCISTKFFQVFSNDNI